MALVLATAAGCAGERASEAPAVSASTASERATEENQASQARLYLVLAQREVEQGKALLRDGKNKDARSVLQMAQSDADLAILKARDSRTLSAAQETKSRALSLWTGASGAAIGGGPLQPPPPADRSPRPTPVEPSAPLTPPAQAPAQPHP
jgi:hypothetical protein